MDPAVTGFRTRKGPISEGKDKVMRCEEEQSTQERTVIIWGHLVTPKYSN